MDETSTPAEEPQQTEARQTEAQQTEPQHEEPQGSTGSALPALPGVSVILPILNEEKHLREAVTMILDQDWEGPLEVVLGLGPSTDATDAVAAQICAEDSRVKTVPNPSGKTPSALNAAISASQYPIVVRVDGHAMIPRDYITTAVELLERTGADNVGGIMNAVGETTFEKAVAHAMKSRFGVGSASFHTGGEEGEAETVYLGAFRRDALDRVGGYDETFLRAQDWEMNHRIRETGGAVWFSPNMVVTYRPRPTFKKLATQYLHYGRWRREVMRRHPETVQGASGLRYLVPPAAVAAFGAGTAAGLLGSTVGPSWLKLGWLAPATYATAITAVSLAAKDDDLPPKSRALLPAVFATMHGSWGWGFLTSPNDLRPE